MSRRKTWLLGAITASVVLVSCIAALLGYELWKIEHGMQLPFHITGGSWMARDDEIGYVPRPNLDVVFQHTDSNTSYHVFTDRLGARVSAKGDQTPPQVDTMVLGCSFTWGFGVPNEDTYAEQLRQSLGVTTVNLGMGGYSSIQCLQRLRRNLDLRPKTVIFGFVMHQLERNVSPCAATPPTFCVTQPYFDETAGVGSIHPPSGSLAGFEPMHIMTHDWEGFGDLLRATTWALRTDIFRYANQPNRSPANMIDSIRFAIREMGEATRAIGADLVVLYIPYLTPHPEGAPQFLMEAAAENGAALVDVAPAVAAHYVQHPGDPLTVTAEDAHPNAQAHRLIADQLVRHLRGGNSLAR